MQLAETSIRRPVFATVLTLLIVLIGAVSFDRLTVREYPQIDEPVVSVTTTFTGASSEVIEAQVTKVLEDSLAGIEGVDVVTSTSRQERSQISVRFALTRDADAAAADVRDKVTRVRQRLPQGIDEPVIAKVEAESFPVIFLALSSDTHNALQLSEMANTLVKPVLQTAPGAAEVNVYGERKFSMRVWIDPDKLAAFRLTVQDVEDALRRSNLEVPAGRIESRQREFNVTAATDLQTAPQFGQVVIRTVNGLPVRIADVARVQEGPVDERSSVRLNGRDSVGVGVIRQATANPLDLSSGVRGLLTKLRADLPVGVT
ncbi:MAG: efflux RND transporter permease subunit, partial [Rhodoferax sp.]|nr:efflux RND transporter permease subunit [Rhodoferax sp.]